MILYGQTYMGCVMKYWIWLLILFFILAFALPTQAGVATDFFDDGFGAASIGLGGACLTNGARADAIFLNPAQMPRYKGTMVEISQNSKFGGDVKEYSGSFIMQVNSRLALGVAMPYSKISGLKQTQEDLITNEGTVTGYFTDSRWGLSVAVGAKINSNIYVGGNIKYFSHKIMNVRGSGYGFDVGLIFAMPKNIELAVVMQNVGDMKINYSTGAVDEVKARYKVGLAYKTEKFFIEADKEFGELQVSTFRLGGGYKLGKHMVVRGGFIKKGENYNYCSGVGINYNKFIIDYAYLNDANGLGDTHRFTIGVLM